VAIAEDTDNLGRDLPEVGEFDVHDIIVHVRVVKSEITDWLFV